MARKSAATFEVECPCCQAALQIDSGVKAVLSFKAKERPHTLEDISAGVEKLRQQESQRDAVFQKQVDAMKSQKDVLSRKFDELLKQAQADPDQGPPRKPFDLD
ncbi:MAG: hypothetical protein IT161_22690 [Bryobacterales bacterium]|nr:hypothetical protein [Bryobacterales bacterium]